MKIESVKEVKFFIVSAIDETDNNNPKLFRRPVYGNSSDWEEAMGESWEKTYGHAELESAFQDHQKLRKRK